LLGSLEISADAHHRDNSRVARPVDRGVGISE
jgi:hypothetical protein